MSELEKKDRELDDIGGRRLVTVMMLTFGVVCLALLWFFIYKINCLRIENELSAVSGQAVEEADPKELVEDVKVSIGDETISYKDLNEGNCEAGVVTCYLYYASDVVTSKNGYIVFDKKADEVTYEDGEYIKIIVPKKEETTNE